MRQNATDKEGSVERGRERSKLERERLYRLSQQQKRRKLSTAMGKNLLIAQTEIDRISSLLSIPEEVKEGSKEIYHKALEKDLIHGRSIERMLAASIYVSCRKHNVPRTLDEIEDATKVERKDIVRVCRLLSNKLGIKLAPASSLEYIPRFCSKLKLRKRVEEKATEIIKEAMGKDILSGKGPTGVAASAIYIATILCNDKKTQKDIAEATGVTEVTLRVRYKEIANKLQIKL